MIFVRLGRNTPEGQGLEHVCIAEPAKLVAAVPLPISVASIWQTHWLHSTAAALSCICCSEVILCLLRGPGTYISSPSLARGFPHQRKCSCKCFLPPVPAWHRLCTSRLHPAPLSRQHPAGGSTRGSQSAGQQSGGLQGNAFGGCV